MKFKQRDELKQKLHLIKIYTINDAKRVLRAHSLAILSSLSHFLAGTFSHTHFLALV